MFPGRRNICFKSEMPSSQKTGVRTRPRWLTPRSIRCHPTPTTTGVMDELVSTTGEATTANRPRHANGEELPLRRSRSLGQQAGAPSAGGPRPARWSSPTGATAAKALVASPSPAGGITWMWEATWGSI
jgi:hypothetical protein